MIVLFGTLIFLIYICIIIIKTINFMTNKEFEAINLAYRSSSDFRLDKNQPIIMMLDGRAFSKFCKRFNKPFDEWFIKTMNETTQYLCKNIQNAVFGFTQSDEISIYIKPCDERTQPWFDARVSKMTSIAASMASTYFLRALIHNTLSNNESTDMMCGKEFDWEEYIPNHDLLQFDCKVWNVPSQTEVEDWFVYRQRDCIRNSKSQFAQAYLSHKELLNLSCDDMISKVENEKGMIWSELPEGLKYGRFTQKISQNFINDNNESYIRSVYISTPMSDNCRTDINNLLIEK